MDKKEFRAVIKHCFLIGKNTFEAKQWLDKHYGDSASGKLTIINWYADFKRGRTNTDDAEKVRKIVLGDRKLNFCEIADTCSGEVKRIFCVGV